MSNLVFEKPTFTARRTVLTPYIVVADAHAAIDWYVQAFGALLSGEPIVGPDGRIGHAELDIGGARLMLAEDPEMPGIEVSAPDPERGAAVTLHLDVADANWVVAQALSAGARLERAVADYPYGRMGVIRDPFGHRWMVMSEPEPGVPQRARPAGVRHGDVGYASLWVADVDRAARFFERVLGWRLVPTPFGGGYQVEGQALHQGIAHGGGPSTLFLAFAVRDMAEAVRTVRDAGGEAGEVTSAPWGLSCMCRDDQGSSFSLFQPEEGVLGGARSPTPDGQPGDLTYVTMEVPDSAKARAFYGKVLGWNYRPGSHPEGWRVEGPQVMVGISGGHETTTLVPMYQARDVESAAAEVRRAGGTTTEPEQQPYGLTAECTDDQGTRFGLWQP